MTAMPFGPPEKIRRAFLSFSIYVLISVLVC